MSRNERAGVSLSHAHACNLTEASKLAIGQNSQILLNAPNYPTTLPVELFKCSNILKYQDFVKQVNSVILMMSSIVLFRCPLLV